jgi:hypothetical protein
MVFLSFWQVFFLHSCLKPLLLFIFSCNDLRLFAVTGFVPKLCSVESDSILVWEQLQGTTLDNVEKQCRQEQLEKIYYQTFIQMDDFHTGNIIVDGDKLVGFIDLCGQ